MKTCTGSNETVKVSALTNNPLFEKNTAIKEEGENKQDLSNKYTKYKKEFDIQFLIKKFSEPEQLDSDNMWYCSNCKEHVQAYKKIQIYKAPKHLIIHMKK